ncbi:MAG: hypothetical protein GY796_35205 [Chloroflexi bacterium]|nr:hypothetical protein [Chloroflexota bacterium]
MSRRRRRQIPYTQSYDGSRPLWRRISSAGWLLISLLMGLGIGLYYAWVIDPIIYIDSGPARFSEAYKAEYIFLVSQSYAADGDWPRAEQRLAALEDPNLPQTVNNLLETYVRDLQSPEALRNMANLAQQLGAEGGAVAIFAPTPDVQPTPTLAAPVVEAAATQTSTPTPTLLPTSTPTTSPTPPPPPDTDWDYRLLNQERICLPAEEPPRIEVVTQNAFLDDLPGVEVQVSWANGRDHFYTGFKPDQGDGYGDFTMESDVSYTVILAEGSPEVSGLRVELCDDGRTVGWQLLFQKTTTASE